MNLIFKVKRFGFFAALLLGVLSHLVFALLPGKKNKSEVPRVSEISEQNSPY